VTTKNQEQAKDVREDGGSPSLPRNCERIRPAIRRRGRTSAESFRAKSDEAVEH